MNYFISFIFFLLFHFTDGASNGLIITECNARSPKFGCSNFQNGDRLKCLESGQIMDWVLKPKQSGRYKLEVKMASGAATSSYQPGAFMQVVLTGNAYAARARGIFIYAENRAGVKVGHWRILDKEEYGHANNCPKSIVHTTAEPKNYVNTFQFRAPPAGTGPITFRALIKEGVANEGEFYWPNARGDVVLQEGPRNEPAIKWFTGRRGESCDEVCAKKTLSCDEPSLSSLSSEQAFKGVLYNNVCVAPFVHRCTSKALGPSVSGNNACYFYNPNCGDNSTPKCGTKSNDPRISRRICACKPRRRVLDEEAEPRLLSNTSSSRVQCNWLILVVLVFFSLFSPGESHNWVYTPSRSERASTVKGCLPKQGIHVQVAPGQEFDVEYTDAHLKNYIYFAVVAAKDEEKLKTVSGAEFEEYIAAAPASARTDQNPNWHKYHRRDDRKNEGKFASNIFKRQILPNDPLYWPRHPELIKHATTVQNAPTAEFLFDFKDADKADDRRVEYSNPKYPFIKSVARFKVVTGLPRSKINTAKFAINGGAGDYIIYYNFRGYYDCIDVRVVTDPKFLQNGKVPNLYGGSAPGMPSTGPEGTTFTRIDHCTYANPLQVIGGKVIEVVADMKACVDACSGNPRCTGISVLPLQNPSTVMQKFQNINLIPWNKVSNKAVFDRLPAARKANMMVCVPVIARTTTETDLAYDVSKDPNSPLFYGTCFAKSQSKGGIIGGDQVTTPKVDWRYNGMCIPCPNRKAFASKSQIIPVWSVKSNQCRNCDFEDSRGQVDTKGYLKTGLGDATSQSTRQLGWNVVKSNARCNEQSNSCPANVKCLPMLSLAGDNTAFVSAESCQVLAARNPRCSKTIVYRPDAGRCFCYANDRCCGQCNARTSRLTTIYTATKLNSIDSKDNANTIEEEGNANVGAIYGIVGASSFIIVAAVIVRKRSNSNNNNESTDNSQVAHYVSSTQAQAESYNPYYK